LYKKAWIIQIYKKIPNLPIIKQIFFINLFEGS
jgi:hypothetical protein